MKQTLRTISRASRLALLQVEELRRLLRDAGIEARLELVSTPSYGDRHKEVSLMSPDVPGDFFTRELDAALLSGTADVAVHSAKDLPYPLPAGIEVVALTAAFDRTDSLVARHGYALATLPSGSRVGTSSAQRKAELLALRQDVEVVPVRGTIEERVAQVQEGRIDALIVASCALERLSLAHLATERLPFATHPLQGSLAVTAAKARAQELRRMLEKIDVRQSYRKVLLVGFGPGDPDLITVKYLMPRKMKIAFASNPSVTDYAGINDIGLVAQLRNGERGFKVYVGGGAGSKPTVGWLYRDFIPAEELYALVKAMKRFFNDNGNRKNKHQARIRYIFYKLGKEETFRLIDKYFDEERSKGRPLPVEEYITTPSAADARTVVLPFKWGNVHLDDEKRLTALRKLLLALDNIGPDTLRFTTRQNIRLRNIPAERLPEIETLIRDYDAEAYDQPTLLSNIVTCTGADTCRLGICLSKGLADAIYQALRDSGLNLTPLADARINITGCPNLCGQPLWADLGFVGKVLHSDHAYPAYQIYVGADYIGLPRLAESVGTLPAYYVPRYTVDLIRRYTEVEAIARSLGQHINFGQWLRSEAGKNDAESIAQRYSDVPLFTQDKNPYFDWGSEEVFKVTQRGKPECSAGLFDMITVDSDSIAAARGKDNYAVIFHASRMLLVTRGVDPQDADGVFKAFKEHFIDTGYIPQTFLPLVEKARKEGQEGTYDAAQAEALADAVTALYKTMDDSLQFKAQPIAAPPAPEQQEEKAKTQEEPVRKKDLRGVLCPMNFVRTKLELAAMQSGEVLEILLDDGKPIENVPGSVKLEGHEVIAQKQSAEGYWTVLIRKK